MNAALTDSEQDAAVQMSQRDFTRLTVTDKFAIISLDKIGRTQTEIAKAVGCSQSTVSACLKLANSSDDVTRKVAKMHAPDAVQHVVDSMAPAAKRGDPTPALRLLELGEPKLGRQATTGLGIGGITVIIGQPGQPVALPDIPISAAPSPARLMAQSETDSNR